jgi:hypothetical protein
MNSTFVAPPAGKSFRTLINAKKNLAATLYVATHPERFAFIRT